MQPEPTPERLRVRVRGAVQGVGFRPYVYRLAVACGLRGWVSNDAGGVTLEVEGAREDLGVFLVRLPAETPPLARIHGLEPCWLEAVGYRGMRIRESEVGTSERPETWVLPDIAVCGDCRRELFDARDRRFRHPFISCTHCGPRYTLIESMPYDRGRTSMRCFPLCARCEAEYLDPGDRRFHAEPIACLDCGPRLAWWDASGREGGVGEEALGRAVGVLAAGGIVAVKGVGGFHLMTVAEDAEAVGRLRERKAREAKPFAVMFGDLRSVGAHAEVGPMEARLLTSPEAPIVLVRRRTGGTSGGQVPPGPGIVEAVAPGSPYLGVLLAYAPLHLLLLHDLGRPVVATSGNRGGEPICADERDAVGRLGGMVDGFLVHDRGVVRAVDDSIVRVMAGREVVLRRARGYVPGPVAGAPVPGVRRRTVLAMGADLKGALAVTDGVRVILGQHLGDLDTPTACDGLVRAVRDLPGLHGLVPEEVVVDAHEGYVSTAVGRGLGLPVRVVQHHHAHVLSCVAENEVSLPVLGVAWDGTGDGQDGTVWGGEFLRVGVSGFERVASLRPFRLPGGEAAVREPRRAALGLLYEVSGAAIFEVVDGPGVQAFAGGERPALRAMLERGLNAPWTTSMGRFLDAVASLLGLCQVNRYEAEAAMALEYAAEQGAGDAGDGAYGFGWCDRMEGTGPRPGRSLDWGPVVAGVLGDLRRGMAVPVIAARVLRTVVDMLVRVAMEVGEARVVLSGGCFQNRWITERAIDGLRTAGFQCFRHQRVPPNDGGIALGQLWAVARGPGEEPGDGAASAAGGGG